MNNGSVLFVGGGSDVRPKMKLSEEEKGLLYKALEEDIGPGDVTSRATIDADLSGKLVLDAKQRGIVCGLSVFAAVFTLVDPGTTIRFIAHDGDPVRPGQRIAIVHGKIRSLLAAERVALNFLQRLSGIATFTHRFVKAVKPYPLKIYDTRKTTPLFRRLEKYAVRTGGGYNHRFGLYDMILIKDNHIDACGGIIDAVNRARDYGRSHDSTIKIGVEVRSIRELQKALPLKVDLILLDNMRLDQIRRAIELVGSARKPELEISGGITLRRLRRLAEAGVRRVSIGALTHSAPALDFSLNYSMH